MGTQRKGVQEGSAEEVTLKNESKFAGQSRGEATANRSPGGARLQ